MMRLHSRSREHHDIAHAFANKRILICGASGNLGSHVARLLAPHRVQLSLWGRSMEKLMDVEAACRHPGTQVHCRSVELTDIQAALAALQDEDDAAPFDCAFFISGAGDTREAGRRIDTPTQLIKLGLLNFVAPCTLAAELGERMGARGQGKIVLVSSAAATHPLPFAAGYAASKAGLSHFAEASRLALRTHGVTVTLVSPGFFAAASEQTYGYARPGEIAPALVARRLIAAAARGQSELVTPRRFLVLRWIGRLMPRALRDRVLLSLPPA